MADQAKIVSGGGSKGPPRRIHPAVIVTLVLLGAIATAVLFLYRGRWSIAVLAAAVLVLLGLHWAVTGRGIDVPGSPGGGSDPRNLYIGRFGMFR